MLSKNDDKKISEVFIMTNVNQLNINIYSDKISNWNYLNTLLGYRLYDYEVP